MKVYVIVNRVTTSIHPLREEKRIIGVATSLDSAINLAEVDAAINDRTLDKEPCHKTDNDAILIGENVIYVIKEFDTDTL